MSSGFLICREVVELVTAYLDGAMSSEDRRRFEDHVAICPPCRGHLSQMRATLQKLGKIPEESLSPEAERALLEAFRDWKKQ